MTSVGRCTRSSIRAAGISTARSAAARDAVKKEALLRAGIGYVEAWLAIRRLSFDDWARNSFRSRPSRSEGKCQSEYICSSRR